MTKRLIRLSGLPNTFQYLATCIGACTTRTIVSRNPIKPSGSAKFPERTGSILKPAGKVPARQGVTKGIRAGARTDARNQVLNGARTAAKADKSLGQRDSLKTTSVKPADKKPANQKPLAVPLNQIPKNLNSPAGKKYLADLDAGKLTRRRR